MVELAQQERGEGTVSVEELEKELAKLRAEQKRLARAVALSDGIAELVDEPKKRNERIRQVEGDLRAAQAAPVAAKATAASIACEVTATFERLRHGIVGAPEEARAALRALFPRGLYFEPEEAAGLSQALRVSKRP